MNTIHKGLTASFPRSQPSVARGLIWLFLSFTCAGNAAQSGDFTYGVVNWTVTITKYTGSGGVVTIPSTIDRLPVTSIGDCAFASCASLMTVTMPSGVTNIGGGAFQGCTRLTSITIPDSVTRIGEWAFYGCTRLTSITMPNSVTSIGEGAFYNCTSLASVTIGNSVTSIGYEAFAWCTSLTNFSIPDSVTSIQTRMFGFCTNLANITIGNGVTNIGTDAFSGCTGLTEVDFQGNCPSGGLNMFDGSSKAIVYYLPGTTGWGTTLAGRPTKMRRSFAPVIDVALDLGVLLEGTTTNLLAHISGVPTPGFQWYFNGEPVIGATRGVFSISLVSARDAGAYSVVASNALGTVTNGPAMLGINNVVASNFFGLVIPDPSGTPLQVQSAAEVRGPWTTLADLTLTNSPEVFIDFTATNAGQRFYRTLQPGRSEAWLLPGWSFTAPAGTHQKIEYVNAEVGFTNWQFLTNLTLHESPYLFIDTSATNKWPRFYRTKPVP